MLGMTIQSEKPELEAKKSELLAREEALKLELADVEKKLLEELAKSEPQRAETPGEVWTPGKGNGTVGSGDWQGWGTALKPALEPITVARKPFKGTVANNVLEHGTGALNIDECRVGTSKNVPASVSKKAPANCYGRYAESGETPGVGGHDPNIGRWPANLIHDGSDEVTELLGDAQRFFYCAKASKADRSEGNTHPTVKPTDLMAYLCRLVTPPGGIVLDPFMGSGSTGKAAMLDGFRFIGIEREAEYLEIAKQRMQEPTQTQGTLL